MYGTLYKNNTGARLLATNNGVRKTANAITAHQVHKNYVGGTKGSGLNGFDLEVKAGTVCGLLGPNGAGKTTAVKVLTTLLQLDSGRATVAGFDIMTQGGLVRQNIGLVGQYAALDEVLTGQQNLVMFGRLSGLSKRDAQKRADELLEQFSLTDSAKISASQYSGGMRRRLDIAVSLITAPPVLFVDEPTTGLDPVGRREVWGAIQSRVDAGTTVLLTTQYLEEADYLAHRISMLKAGVVIAEGTPDDLKAMIGGDWIDITLPSEIAPQTLLPMVESLASGESRIDAQANRLSIPVQNRTKALIAVSSALSEAGIEPDDISLRRPTLDEVFIHLTGSTQEESAKEVA